MKPSIGRIVIVPMDPAENNGSPLAPAVITRVWSDTLVNLRVLGDSHTIDWRTSVKLLQSPEELAAEKATHAVDVPLFGAYWPPRV